MSHLEFPVDVHDKNRQVTRHMNHEVLQLCDFFLNAQPTHYTFRRVDIYNLPRYNTFPLQMIVSCVFSFCPRHGPEQAQKQVQVPPDLLGIAEFMMPKLIFRLIQHLRDNFRTGTCTL